MFPGLLVRRRPRAGALTAVAPVILATALHTFPRIQPKPPKHMALQPGLFWPASQYSSGAVTLKQHLQNPTRGDIRHAMGSFYRTTNASGKNVPHGKSNVTNPGRFDLAN